MREREREILGFPMYGDPLLQSTTPRSGRPSQHYPTLPRSAARGSWDFLWFVEVWGLGFLGPMGAPEMYGVAATEIWRFHKIGVLLKSFQDLRSGWGL